MFLRACGGCRRLPCLRPRVVPTTLVYLCLHVFLLLVVCSSLDFYTILGVPRNAEKAAIKKAYHKLALDLHPDKNDFTPGSAEAEEAVRKFIEVATAYEVLSDSARRKRYDTLGPDAGDANSGGGRSGDSSGSGAWPMGWNEASVVGKQKQPLHEAAKVVAEAVHVRGCGQVQKWSNNQSDEPSTHLD